MLAVSRYSNGRCSDVLMLAELLADSWCFLLISRSSWKKVQLWISNAIQEEQIIQQANGLIQMTVGHFRSHRRQAWVVLNSFSLRLQSFWEKLFCSMKHHFFVLTALFQWTAESSTKLQHWSTRHLLPISFRSEPERNSSVCKTARTGLAEHKTD